MSGNFSRLLTLEPAPQPLSPRTGRGEMYCSLPSPRPRGEGLGVRGREVRAIHSRFLRQQLNCSRRALNYRSRRAGMIQVLLRVVLL